MFDDNYGLSAADAIARWEDTGWPYLPHGPYVIQDQVANFVLFVHLVDRKVKAAIVVTDEPRGGGGSAGWRTSRQAGCDPAEDAPSDVFAGIRVWTANRRRVPMSELVDQQECHSAGRSIRMAGRLYAGDPSLVVADPAQYVVPYLPNARLPSDGIPTAYRYRDLRLWTVSDHRAVYIGTAAHVERYGRIKGQEIERTDCG